ncbi:unnamed protein product [Ilex paraguariensis]|uniref:Uncharacterized protein n=1 Tax=Ilex paraguariensis TaxID=185542 RepID=A0ABC8S7E6_9AQUA
MGASTELSSHTSLVVKSVKLILHQDQFGLAIRMMMWRVGPGLYAWLLDWMMMWWVGPGLYAWLLDWFAVLLCFGSCLLFWQTVAVSWAVTKGAGAEFGYIANQLGLNGCCTGLFLIWGFCIRSCLGVQELD